MHCWLQPCMIFILLPALLPCDHDHVEHISLPELFLFAFDLSTSGCLFATLQSASVLDFWLKHNCFCLLLRFHCIHPSPPENVNILRIRLHLYNSFESAQTFTLSYQIDKMASTKNPRKQNTAQQSSSNTEASEFADSKVAVGAALTFIEDLQVRFSHNLLPFSHTFTHPLILLTQLPTPPKSYLTQYTEIPPPSKIHSNSRPLKQIPHSLPQRTRRIPDL